MTKAIELADKLEVYSVDADHPFQERKLLQASAIELRRLAAVEQELKLSEEMNEQLREQNTLVDFACAKLEQENAKLVKELAESKLHALNGWQRYEMANSMSNSLQQELADLKAAMGEPVAITQVSQAMQMYAKHPTYRGTRVLGWLEVPQGVRDEWLQKVNQ